MLNRPKNQAATGPHITLATPDQFTTPPLAVPSQLQKVKRFH